MKAEAVADATKIQLVQAAIGLHRDGWVRDRSKPIKIV